jgi:zinc protease
MALAVVGDINGENLLQIEKIFSKPEKREVINYNPVNEPALDKPVSYQKEMDVIGAHTLIGIHLRKGDEFLHINHPDYFVLKVINETLGNSRMTSRLFREIREKRGLVYDIDSNIESHRDISHISFDFVSEKENFDKVVSILFEQLNKIRTEKMPEDELVKVKSRILSQQRFGNSDDKKRADSFATYEAAGWGGIEEFSRHNEKIMKVTADDVLRVANEFINPEKYALVKFIPKTKSL